MKKQSNIPLETKIVDLKIVVDVYLRNSRKQALLVHISERTQITHLNRAVASFFKIPQDSQVLMFKGKQLRDLGSCRIENKAIIHVIDTRNITPLITVKLKKPNSDSFEFYSVESSELVGDFIANNIQYPQQEKPFLVYASKRLKNNRTFTEQLVQNQSELTCLYQRRDQRNTNRIYKRQHNMLYDQAREQQKKAASQKNSSGLQEYLPQTNSKAQQCQPESPESMKNIKQSSSKDDLKDSDNKVAVKQVQVALSHPNLKVKNSISNSSESLLIDCTQKKNRQEKEVQNNQSVQGSIISEITAREQNIELRNEETCFFQCVLKGLASETLPPHHQVNWSQGELKKIAAQLEKWQQKTKVARTGNKQTDSSLQAVELPLLRHVRESSKLDQTSYFTPLLPKQLVTQLQPIKQHLLSHKTEQKKEELKDLIVEVELGSSVKNRKQLSDARVELESLSSSKKKLHGPQSAIMIDISFGQDHVTASSNLSKQQKLSQDQDQLESLQNLEIKKEFYSAKDFHSFSNMLVETEIRASPGHQKLVQKQFVFRSQPFYFEPLDFYISMFYEEFTGSPTHLE